MYFLRRYGFDIFLIILLAAFFIYSETKETKIVVDVPKTAVQEERSPAPETEATQEPEKNTEKSNLSSNSETIVEPAPQPVIQKQTLPPITSAINDYVREAAVNIFCTSKTSGSFSPASGSGVIIDPRGVILTNAHIAQYFLLKDYHVDNFIECVVRQGSPATSHFTARLLYLPPAWIEENKGQIASQEPKGTGEYDFAFLLITGTTNPDDTPPSEFPFVKISNYNDGVDVGTEALVAGYPAGFFGGITVTKSLSLVSTVVHVKELFTFTKDILDVLSLGGSLIAQKGSSGSPVVTGDGNLQGIIVTATQEATTDLRDLSAITTGHIGRSLTQFTGGNMASLLSGNLKQKADDFNALTAPGLTQILIDEIEKPQQ